MDGPIDPVDPFRVNIPVIDDGFVFSLLCTILIAVSGTLISAADFSRSLDSLYYRILIFVILTFAAVTSAFITHLWTKNHVFVRNRDDVLEDSRLHVPISVPSVSRAAPVNNLLAEFNFPSICIRSGMSQEERLTRYKSFKEGRKRILVATDLVGRGIDMERANIVINYDMPDSADTYLNRVGIAGKLNNGGSIRNVLDVGCGVGTYLLSHDVMSLAPNDVRQILFALERGTNWLQGHIHPRMNKERWSGLVPGPLRLAAPPPRLEEIGVTEQFHEDTDTWLLKVTEYWKVLKPTVQRKFIRDLMNMSSNGFDKDIWVMNFLVVESSPMNVIYDRATHDWCEAFSTYPWNTFTETKISKCSIEDLLIELDRILRPEGFVIIRDSSQNISYMKKYLTFLKWQNLFAETIPKCDSLSTRDERVLIARKRLWSMTAISEL